MFPSQIAINQWNEYIEWLFLGVYQILYQRALIANPCTFIKVLHLLNN
jgi:hypothetical protein